ncbi:MAG: cation:proton antiporter [bacterium]|nr:cation:proton antiporter [bacterium]
MKIALVIFFIGLIVFLAHLFSALFKKTRIPDVLILVLIGFLLGPTTGFVSPKDFGKVGNIFTTVALVVILFESGVGLSFSTLRKSIGHGVKLTIINFIGAAVIVTLISIVFFKMSTIEGLLMGTILGATAPSIVIPMISKLSLQDNSRAALILESTFSEALCIVIALCLLQTVKYNEIKVSIIIWSVAKSFVFAALIGAVTGLLWSHLLNHIRQLKNNIFTTIAFVFIIFGITELVGLSGAIASFALGIVLGNVQHLQLPEINKPAYFKSANLNETEKMVFAEAVFLLQTFFFIYIGLSIRLTNMTLVVFGLVLTLAMFIIRIPMVRLAMGRTIPRFDVSIMSAMAPRGLAAAVLATLPLQAGLKNGMIMQNLVYAVIPLSIIITTICVFLIDKNALSGFYAFLFPKHST